MRVAGVDGCRSGWIAVLVEGGEPASAHLAAAPRLDVLLDAERPDLAVVDMPIGLTSGPAARDVEAATRAVLKGKASSVFSTPCRQALSAASYAEAGALNRATLGKGLAKQTWALMRKIAEVDDVVRARGQGAVREGHPELSFVCLAGAPVLEPKRGSPGQDRRRRLLEEQGFPVGRLLAARPGGFRGGVDDGLDACALAWSALRVGRGDHVLLPPTPSRDAVGLEMSGVA